MPWNMGFIFFLERSCMENMLNHVLHTGTAIWALFVFTGNSQLIQCTFYDRCYDVTCVSILLLEHQSHDSHKFASHWLARPKTFSVINHSLDTCQQSLIHILTQRIFVGQMTYNSCSINIAFSYILNCDITPIHTPHTFWPCIFLGPLAESPGSHHVIYTLWPICVTSIKYFLRRKQQYSI